MYRVTDIVSHQIELGSIEMTAHGGPVWITILFIGCGYSKQCEMTAPLYLGRIVPGYTKKRQRLIDFLGICAVLSLSIRGQ